LAHLLTRTVELGVLFGSPFDGTRFDPLGTIRHHRWLRQRQAQVTVPHPVQGIGKTDAVHRHFLPRGGLQHHQPHQVVHDQEHMQFLLDSRHVWRRRISIFIVVFKCRRFTAAHRPLIPF